MDAFEIRLSLLSHLRKLNASVQSISKVVSYAITYAPRCGDDLWTCFIDECRKGALNHRINILHTIDTLLNNPPLPSPYTEHVARDLGTIIGLVVPEGREGVVNLMSAMQILESWRTKHLLPPGVVENVEESLQVRRESLRSALPSSAEPSLLPQKDILRRIEEDRERHKRLRERLWVMPPRSSDALVTLKPAGAPDEDDALDVEFEQAWENTSDWNEDDEEGVRDDVWGWRPWSSGGM